jgi:hypothetical protein
MKLRTIIGMFLNAVHPTFNGQRSIHAREGDSLDAKIDRVELRERYKAYLAGHYLSLHITVVSVVLAAAGVAAASLITRPMGADHQLLVLWLLWIGNLAATAVAYGGPMVGAFALPASMPSVSDLLLPLFVGVTEFLLFTILIRQVTAVGLSVLVNTWLITMALFGLFAELSVLRAWHHYAAGLREDVYSDDVARIIKQYLRCLLRDSIGAGTVTALASIGAGLRSSGAITWPAFIFPLVITVLLILGLQGHSETAKMWRALLPSYKLSNEAMTERPSLSCDLRQRPDSAGTGQSSPTPQRPKADPGDSSSTNEQPLQSDPGIGAQGAEAADG